MRVEVIVETRCVYALTSQQIGGRMFLAGKGGRKNRVKASGSASRHRRHGDGTLGFEQLFDATEDDLVIVTR